MGICLRSGALVVLLFAGCSRETLPLEPDDEPLDAAVPEGDALVEEAGPGPDDGGGSCAADTDGDGVCDSKDNCSKVANADQADSNGNGVGDRCETVMATCNAEAVSASVEVGTATFSNIKVQGRSNEVITVSPGADLQLTLDFQDTCVIPVSTEFIVLGFDDASRGECVTASDRVCTIPAISSASGSISTTVKAPSTPGVHYLKALAQQSLVVCPEILANSGRIFALCVQ